MTPLMIGAGEALWDLLPAGRQLGGAPANFAYHARALGARGAVVSAVGDDAWGREILERLDGLGLDRRAVTTVPGRPTGTVTVTLDARGVPSFTIHENVAWDYIPVSEAALSLASRADALCFGTLAQRAETSRQSIRRLIQATPPGALRIFDVNLRQRFFSPELIDGLLAVSNVLKLNDAELPIVADLFALRGSEADILKTLVARRSLRLAALTRGEKGCLLVAPQGICERDGLKVTVSDTVGAGDAFTAAMALGLLWDWPLDRIAEQATRVAACVCARPGATPAYTAADCGWAMGD